jgi:hypothetical protein
MNKEYYQAKADLCRNLAIKQMVEGEAKEAGANLIRMVNALNQINLINYKEEKGMIKEVELKYTANNLATLTRQVWGDNAIRVSSW